MKLVRVQGTMPQLNEFIGSCCMDGRFDLEPATRYMSESLGYGALNEENPHTAIRDQIETMAQEANIELHKGQQHSDPVDAEGRSYLSDLLEQIDELCAERKILLDQKKLCEDGIEQYSHFTGLKVNVDDLLDCAHVKVRFGFLPTEGYNKLMNNYGDDPYILFTPCNQTKAGYSTGDDGFVTLTYYTSGARSFYTKDKAIRTPADLKGLKIRVQDMKSQTDMMSYLGGIPVAMSYGDVYTSLQTGIIDGTENNETALTTGKHGEVCKVYSVDQHAMIPDVLIMSEKVWKTISPEDQQILLEAAHDSTDAHKVMWDTAVEEAVKEAQETMGVEFVYDVDKEAFREATQPMIEAYEEEYPGVKTLMDTIEKASLFFVWTRRISSRPLTSGRPT